MELKPRDGGQVMLAPWPFYVDLLPVGVLHRRLPTAVFASEEEFRWAFFATPLQVLHSSWCAGPPRLAMPTRRRRITSSRGGRVQKIKGQEIPHLQQLVIRRGCAR